MGFLEERDFAEVPTIPEFYKGKTILITGGTGFMGKVLIEKLLYSCTDLDRIYLLMRPKKGVKSEDRLAALYSTLYLFDRLKKERPGVFESKVHVVAGDILENGLGKQIQDWDKWRALVSKAKILFGSLSQRRLSEEDRTLLVNRVNIIFHVAASVRFDDTLTFACKLNLKGAKQIVDLAKEATDLKALVHVSTTYSNTNRDPIEEVMYPPHADWRDTLKVCENVDEHTLRILTPKYLGELPNTYTFTKQLAEHVVYEQRGQLPAIIIRPSIVVSSFYEPISGWVDNFNGPVGISVAAGKGIMRTVYSDPDIIADYIPVDICIKNIVTAAWARGTKPLEPTDDVEIYNSCAGNLKKMTMGELSEIGARIMVEVPFDDMLWITGGRITTSKTINFIKVLLLHLLPAMFIDLILWILGKKTLLVKLQRKIYIANMELHYYLTQQWTFTNQNFVLLRSRIKDEDKEHFYYEFEKMDKFQFYRQSIIGTRKYLLKEKDEDLPKARVHHQRLLVLDKLVKYVFYGSLFWWVTNTSYVQNLLIFFKELF